LGAKMLASLSIVLLAAGVLGADEPPAASETPKPRMVPDERYSLKPGDRAVLCFFWKNRFESVTCSKQSFSYHEYWKSLSVKDYDGSFELDEKGYTFEARVGTGVLVIELEDFETSDPRPNCAVVRVMDGPHKGTKVWVSASHVTPPASCFRFAREKEAAGLFDDALGYYRRTIVLDAASPEAKEAEVRIVAIEGMIADEKAEVKAGRLVVIARNLEKSNKPAAALGYYRQITKECPRSSFAEEAAERMKILGPFR
jgi:hypothetical protein